MFAILKTGGKQYKVSKDSIINIEKVPGESGKEVKFDAVLLIGENNKESLVGSPIIKGASVKAEIMEQFRGDKIIVFKKKKRKNYTRKNGHRQDLTKIKITDILRKA
ncbi:MAG TPA: 50S ribosomal protein L21 [Candidatus Megaira endosymbiont of Hartmannula sinica]|nr:50S ribosomal protein L21 [Candidatus Megaera endosymbiont of Hartmannula sinica]